MTSKADYLKKYMEPDKPKEPKKRKKTRQKGNIAIIDNDVHWDDMKSDAQLQLEGEFAPAVVNVTDDRPEALRRKQDGWKQFGKNGNDDRSPVRKAIKSDKSRNTPKGRFKSVKTRPEERSRPDSDTSPPRRKRVDSDGSPVRTRVPSSSPSRRMVDHGDESPPRKRVHSPSPTRRVDSDESPPRRRINSDESPPRRARIDSDSSPVRRKQPDSDESPPRRTLNKNRPFTHSDESPPRNKKPGMSDGTKAGLNTREEFKSQKPKMGANSNIAKLIDEAKQQETVYREKGTGRKRDFKAEEEVSEQEKARKADEVKNYKVWNKGKKQIESHKENIESYMKEVDKPLARYKDDKDYNDMKKSEMHSEDPMLRYVQSKQQSKTKTTRKKHGKQVYTGSSTCPNRFSIPPGYRWDGVDRSTGYETKLFKHFNETKNRAFEAWRANTDDF